MNVFRRILSELFKSAIPQDFKPQLDSLLNSHVDNSQLEAALADINPRELQKLPDGAWAIKLYDRSPTLFENFIGRHLKHIPTIEILLPRLETEEHQSLFQQLYPRVASVERYNADVLKLIKTSADFDDIVKALEWRRGDWAQIREDVLIALYNHDPQAFDQKYRHLFEYTHNRVFELPKGNLDDFRRVAIRNAPDSPLAGVLFRHFATVEEWEWAVLHLIANPPDETGDGENRESTISRNLKVIHPHSATFEVPLDLIVKLIETFGEEALPYLASKVNWFIREAINILFELEKDNDRLGEALNQHILKHTDRIRFRHLAETWAPLLYERNPALLNDYLFDLQQNTAVIQLLLPLLRRDGHYELYRQLYARVAHQDEWNNEILGLVRSRLSVGSIERELVRLDVLKSQYYGQRHVTLSDETATALYRRSPDAFREFIWRYLVVGGHDYPELRKAVNEAKDRDFTNRLFRKVNAPEAWHEEMQKLLDSDIAPEHILEELEKRKPARMTKVKPHILIKFMQKYGEAVLPFFETYIDWTSPKRLNALFDLNLERGELLKELNAIARRQPVEFAGQAQLWAPRLYDLSPNFFGGFLIRNLGWNAQGVGEQLLRRMEADGHDNLFSELYPRFMRGNEWNRDVARLVAEIKDDEILNAALKRRSRVWGGLPDDLAAKIYERNPDLFREFLVAHVGTQWGQQKYPRLMKAAEKRGDQAMLDLIGQSTDAEQAFKQQAQRLLQNNVPAVVDALNKLIPVQSWRVKDVTPLVGFIEKYGDTVMPFFLNNQTFRYYFNNQKFIDAVKKHTSPANYWRFIFAVNNKAVWNDALEALSKRQISEGELRFELAALEPPADGNRWNRWTIKNETAVRLYFQHPKLTRPFLERHLESVPDELFTLAEQNHDEDFLDYMTYRMILEIQSYMYSAYNNRQQKEREKARKTIDTVAAVALKRLNRLYTESPQTYVRHAAAILSFIKPFEWSASVNKDRHPVYNHLAQMHHADWRHSSEAIRELMESPNIFVQLIGLEILSEGGEESAARVMENLQAFRVLLLGAGRKSTKRLVLKCLENAAATSPDAAAKMRPLLADTMNYFARTAVPDEIAVLYVKTG